MRWLRRLGRAYHRHLVASAGAEDTVLSTDVIYAKLWPWFIPPLPFAMVAGFTDSKLALWLSLILGAVCLGGALYAGLTMCFAWADAKIARDLEAERIAKLPPPQPRPHR